MMCEFCNNEQEAHQQMR